MIVANLAKKIKKTRQSLSADALAGFRIRIDETALLVIDVQKAYCDPKHPARRGSKRTVAVAEKIQSLVPAFRKAGIPVYAVYFSMEGKKPRNEIDFFKFKPARKDRLVAKFANSAFAGSDIEYMLNGHKRKTLLVCGFNTGACVAETVYDAMDAGFKVCLMKDLSANDASIRPGIRQDIKDMEEMGAVIATSSKILSRIR